MPLRWWAKGKDPEVVVLSREDCQLCEEMLTVVRSQAPDAQIQDIDAEAAAGRMDAQTHDRWTTLVPVLLIEGEPVAHWRVSGEELRQALRSARRQLRSN